MKKGFPIHPPLIAAFPILSLYAANYSRVPTTDLWRPLLLSILGGVLLWGLLTAVLRDVRKGAIAASTLITMFFFFGDFNRTFFDATYMGNRLQMEIVWGLLSVAIVLGLLRVQRKNPGFSGLLNIAGVFLVLTTAGTTLMRALQTRGGPDRPREAIAAKAPPNSPDIFYIILDGYGRQDALKKIMNFDNSEFIEALRKRGFFVAEHSHSNYCQTEISLSSSLNLDFAQNLLPKLAGQATDDRSPLDKLIDANKVADFLRSKGYEYWAISTGFPTFEFRTADHLMHKREPVSLLESTLLDKTPISIESNAPALSLFIEKRKTVLSAIDNIHQLAEQKAARPRFVFAHILAPHPPFVFGSNGEFTKSKTGYGLWDGSHYMAQGGSPASYRNGYVGQLQYLNTLVLSAIDALQKQPGVPPIIFIQGDHGSKLELNQDSLEKTNIHECFCNLAAFYAPARIQSQFYDTITPANTFRILFNGMFDAKLNLNPDASYFSTWGHPYEFTDVTKKLAESLP